MTKIFTNQELGVRLTLISDGKGESSKLESISARRESMLSDDRIKVWINEVLEKEYERINNCP